MSAKQSEQWRDVLASLRTGPLTPLKAWVDLGVMRVADPIEKLRKRGYIIETNMRDFRTTRGRDVRFAEYRLLAEPAGTHIDRAAKEAFDLMAAQ